jgi:hypothetical protein
MIRSCFLAESLATRAGLLDARSSFSFSVKRGMAVFFLGFFPISHRLALETKL